jgi:hypothetical protein
VTTGADIYELSIPEVPPSLNGMGFGSRGAHMKFHRLKKKWEGLFQIVLLEQRVPKGLRKVQASARLRFPVKRKRDEGNFRWLLEKALGDVLQAAGHLSDDTPDEFTFTALDFDPAKGSPRTTVTLEVFRGSAD